MHSQEIVNSKTPEVCGYRFPAGADELKDIFMGQRDPVRTALLATRPFRSQLQQEPRETLPNRV